MDTGAREGALGKLVAAPPKVLPRPDDHPARFAPSPHWSYAPHLRRGRARRTDPTPPAAARNAAPAHRRLLQHVYLPYILAGYLQLAFQALLFVASVAVLLLFGYQFAMDVSKKVRLEHRRALHTIQQCRRNFDDNRCAEVAQVVPHMREQCERWRACFQQTSEQLVVNRARLLTETLAEMLNGFLDTISYKSIACVALALVAVSLMGSAALNMARVRMSQDLLQVAALQERKWATRSSARGGASRVMRVQDEEEEEAFDDADATGASFDGRRSALSAVPLHSKVE